MTSIFLDIISINTKKKRLPDFSPLAKQTSEDVRRLVFDAKFQRRRRRILGQNYLSGNKLILFRCREKLREDLVTCECESAKHRSPIIQTGASSIDRLNLKKYIVVTAWLAP